MSGAETTALGIKGASFLRTTICHTVLVCKRRQHPCRIQSGCIVRRKKGRGGEANKEVENSENKSFDDNEEKKSERSDFSLAAESVLEIK